MADANRPGNGGSASGDGSRPGGSSRRRRRGGRNRSGQGQRSQSGSSPQRQQPGGGSGSGSSGRSSANRAKAQSRGATAQNQSRRGSRGGRDRQSDRPRTAPQVALAPTPVVEETPLVATTEVRATRARARRITALGALVPAVVVGLIVGVAVSLVAGAIAGAAVLVVAALTIGRGATAIALRVLGARPVREDELPRLENLIDGLCPTFGVRRPVLMAVDDELPNACSLGTRPDRAVLVVTTGLERSLDLVELEGVIGHELAHLKRGDTAVSSVAVAVLAPIIWLTGGDAVLHRALGRGREMRADQVAVRAVRYPPGLRAALSRSLDGPTPGPGSAFSGRRLSMSRWLWIDPSVGHRGEAEIGDLDLTVARIAALAEL